MSPHDLKARGIINPVSHFVWHRFQMINNCVPHGTKTFYDMTCKSVFLGSAAFGKKPLKPTSRTLEPHYRRRISSPPGWWLLSTDLNARYGPSKQTDSRRTCLCNFRLFTQCFCERGKTAAFQAQLPPFEGCVR